MYIYGFNLQLFHNFVSRPLHQYLHKYLLFSLDFIICMFFTRDDLDDSSENLKLDKTRYRLLIKE